MSQTIEQLFEAEALTETPPTIIDRSTLERWATCPAQAWMIDNGRVSNSSPLTDAGNEVHRIIAEACAMRHMEAATERELREYVQASALTSRPDVQPAVIVTTRRAAYPLAALLCRHEGTGVERHPDDLICYDGGKDEYSGQIGFDFVKADPEKGIGAIRLTAEMDLMMAGVSKEEVDLWDWKSGFKRWTASEVKESFQFQFYSFLVLCKYPALKRVRVRVLMTRDGESTSPVDFMASDLFAIGKRIETAIALLMQHRKAKCADFVPAWPSPDKCSICPGVVKCPMCHLSSKKIGEDPEAYLRQYVAIDAAASEMKAVLTKTVRQLGRDFEFGDVAFGANKPTAARAKACDVYDPRGSSKGAE